MPRATIGVLNARVGHPRPARLARRIRNIARRFGLDAVVVNECEPRYLAHLKRYFHVAHLDGGRAEQNSVLLYTLPGSVRAVSSRKTSPGWIRARRNRNKGFHPGRVSPLINFDGLRLLIAHGPPRPHRGGQWKSRRRARNVFYRNVFAVADLWNRRGRKWLVAGDFNVPVHGPFLKARAARRRATTHGRGIDGFIAGPGVRVRRVRRHRLKGRFDHPLIVAEVTW